MRGNNEVDRVARGYLPQTQPTAYCSEAQHSGTGTGSGCISQ